jgi:hypothetical protein
MTASNGFSRVVTGKKNRQCDSATGRQSQQKGNAAKRGKCKTRKAGNARATSGSKECERSRKVQKCALIFSGRKSRRATEREEGARPFLKRTLARRERSARGTRARGTPIFPKPCSNQDYKPALYPLLEYSNCPSPCFMVSKYYMARKGGDGFYLRIDEIT